MRQLPAHIRSGLALALLILPLALLAWAAEVLWSSYRDGTAEISDPKLPDTPPKNRTDS